MCVCVCVCVLVLFDPREVLSATYYPLEQIFFLWAPSKKILFSLRAEVKLLLGQLGQTHTYKYTHTQFVYTVSLWAPSPTVKKIVCFLERSCTLLISTICPFVCVCVYMCVMHSFSPCCHYFAMYMQNPCISKVFFQHGSK